VHELGAVVSGARANALVPTRSVALPLEVVPVLAGAKPCLWLGVLVRSRNVA